MKGNVTVRFVVLALLISPIVLPLQARAQRWTWTTSQIDTLGTDSSVAIDNDGNVHVSYEFPTHGELKYGFLPAGRSHWFVMTLDQMLGDFSTGIAVDAQGKPYVCYSPGSLKLALFDGKRWKIQEIDPGNGLVHFYCSIRFGPDGAPQLSWYVETPFSVHHAILQNGVWIARTADNQDLPGKINCIAIDRLGNPHLSYIGLYGTKLKYAHFDGKNWIRVILEGPNQGLEKSQGDTGMGNSIAIDRDNNPMVSYFDTSSLKFAHFVDGKWRFEIVDHFDPVGQWGWRTFRSTTVLDRNGHPHIGYQSPLGLKHAWWDGRQWRTQLILAPTGTTFDGSMAMDDRDNIYFTYTEPAQHTLMLAIGHFAGDQEAAKAESSPEVKKQP